MSMIPTISVMREDGKGYHLVNAPEESVEAAGAFTTKADAFVEALEAHVAAKPKPAPKPRKAKAKK